MLCDPLARFGTEEQKKRYLPRLVKAELLGCYALSEPGAGSDAASIKTRAEKVGGTYVLNGTKTWVSMIKSCRWVLAFGTLDPALGHKGICAFVVESPWPGLTAAPVKRWCM